MSSELRVDKIIPTTGAPTNGGGGIIQVVQVLKTDAESLTSNTTPQLIPGMEATITPKFATSKVLVQIVLNASVGAAYAGMYGLLRRGSTNICIGDADGSNVNRASFSFQSPIHFSGNASNLYGPGQTSLNFLDSPATTNAVTYGIYHAEADNGGTALYINRPLDGTNSLNYSRVASSIILMEVSA